MVSSLADKSSSCFPHDAWPSRESGREFRETGKCLEKKLKRKVSKKTEQGEDGRGAGK